MKKVELNEVEKATLREVVQLNIQAQRAVESLTLEAQRRTAHVESAINTVVKLRGLDPSKWQLRYDLNQNIWELQEIPEPVKSEPAGPSAEQIAEIAAELDKVDVPVASNGTTEPGG